MKEKKGEHPFGDAGQLILFGVFVVVWAGDSFFLRVSTFLSGAVPLYLRIAFLVASFVLGLLLARSGHVVVGGGERPKSVVASGAFRYVRHPLYLGAMLFYLGLVVSTLSLLSAAVLAVGFAFYNYIAGYEERLLVAKMGADYSAYKKKTGKWMPRPGQRHSDGGQ